MPFYETVLGPFVVAHTSPGADTSHPRAHRLTLKYNLMWAPQWHAYVDVSSLCCNISYNRTAAVALTLSDSMRPRSGNETRSSQAAATRGRSPRPSAPRTITTPPR